MKIRCFLAISMMILSASGCTAVHAARAKHHHAVTTASAVNHHPSIHSKAYKQHLNRLAKIEKAQWRQHLAKLKELPRHQRIAMKRHDRRLKKLVVIIHKIHVERKIAQTAHTKRLAKLIARQMASALQHKRHNLNVAALKRAHALRLAKLNHRHGSQAKLGSARTKHRAALIALAASQMMSKSHKRRILEAKAVAAHAVRVEENRAARAARIHKELARENQVMRIRNVAIARRRAALTLRLATLVADKTAHYRNQQLRIAKRLAKHNANIAMHNQRMKQKMAALQARFTGPGSSHSIRFWQTEVANVPVKVITVDLNDPNVKISAVMARHGSGTSEPMVQMIKRSNPNVAVTGTFFSLDNLQPIGDIVIDGSLIHFGGMGTALCITPDNRANMVNCQWGRHHNWNNYDFVVACGPRLLHNSRVVLDPGAERFRDRHMLARNSRIAVGITPGNKIIFVMTREGIYLGRLAKVMQDLGAAEAMNLDAGTSTGFYYDGTTLARPGRKLTNMIVVYSHKSRYERALDQLVPAPYRRADAHASHAHIGAG